MSGKKSIIPTVTVTKEEIVHCYATDEAKRGSDQNWKQITEVTACETNNIQQLHYKDEPTKPVAHKSKTSNHTRADVTLTSSFNGNSADGDSDASSLSVHSEHNQDSRRRGSDTFLLALGRKSNSINLPNMDKLAASDCEQKYRKHSSKRKLLKNSFSSSAGLLLNSDSLQLSRDVKHTKDSLSLDLSNKSKSKKKRWKINRKKRSLTFDKQSIVSSPKMHTIKGTVDKVLSPSYRQKNDDIHKYFKDINETERLLADYTCAFVKDILIQGRLYMTEKFICFRANILKWQTHVQIDFRDIANLNKVKTALVFPNAIQILMKEPQRKYTFTSFTARDKAFNVMSTLWENAQEEKEFTVQETRDFIQRNYGDYFSSDDDEIDGAVASSLQNCDKTSRKTQTPVEMNGEKYSLTSSSRQSSQDLELEEDESSSETKDDEEDDGSSGDDSDVSSFFEDDEEEELSKKKKRKPSKSSKSSKESPTIAGPGKHFLEDEMRMSLFRQYPTSAENMWRIVFGEEDECPFWKDTLINKGTTGIEFGRWKDDEKVEGQKVRSLGYTLRLDNAIGPKTSYCAEMQVMYKESVPGLSYGADCIVQNHGIPYADYFQTIMRYSIIRIDDQTCELRITSGLHYRKTPWGLMKNFIEKNVWAGLAQNFEKLENQIMTFIIEDQQKPKQQTDVPNQLKKRPSLATRSRKNVPSPTGKKPKSTKTRKAAIVPTASSDVINNNVPPSTDDKRIYQPSLMHKPQPTVSSDEEPFVKYQTWIRAAVTILIFMLVYTNISMYRRLNALEKSMPLKRDSTDLFDSSNIYRQDAAYIELLERMDNRLHKMEGWLMENKNKNDERWSQLLALCKSSLVNTEESEYRSSREYDDSNGKR